MLDRDQALHHVQRLAHRRSVADDTKHQLGLRMRRHHVGRHAAVDQPDRVVRAAQLDVLGQLYAAHHHQRVQQLVDRRFPQLRKRRVRGAARRHQLHAQDAAGGDAEPVVGGLAVDQVAHARRRALVGDAGAVAAALFADHEQQRDARFPALAQPLRGRHLRRQDALGVAHAAADQHAALDAGLVEGRHAVVVRGQHHAGLVAQRRKHVEAAVADRLARHAVASSFQ